MAAKFKVGDKVQVPENMEGATPWWRGKPATVRAVLEDSMLYEVLFDDAEDLPSSRSHARPRSEPA